LFLVGVDGFDFEVECLLSRFERLLSGFDSLKMFPLLLLDVLDGCYITL
jgi:hypothetical protein